MSSALTAIVAVLIAVTKVDPKKAAAVVFAAIGVVTVVLEALKAVGAALLAQ